jgi:hypothetical protein
LLSYALLIAVTIVLLLARKRWRNRITWRVGWLVRLLAVIVLHAGVVMVLLNADKLNTRADLLPYLWTLGGLLLFSAGLGVVLLPAKP